MSTQQPTRNVRRVRRDSAEAQDELRRSAVDAALALFASGGLDAVSMRGVAGAVGVTPMALYRYFDGKADLLLALWEQVLQGLAAVLAVADQAPGSAGERLLRSGGVFLRHWEDNPEHFRLVYMSDGGTVMSSDRRVTGISVYRTLLQSQLRLICDYALELGLPTEHAPLARDLRHALCVGYLHSRIVNRRYPWTDIEALRAALLATMLPSVAQCLRGPNIAT